MLLTTKAIVLNTIKFQDKKLIVKCFTAEAGLKSYMAYISSSKKSNTKLSYFQPLSQLELVVIHKNKGTIENFKEIKIANQYYTNHSNIYKNAIVFFISEWLSISLKEEEKNEDLYTFIETSLLWLDSHEIIANFHVIFLIQLTKYLGFYPEQSDEVFFDLKEGIWVSINTPDTISEFESLLFKKLLTLSFDNLDKLFTQSERQTILNILIKYYSQHVSGFKKPKSLEVLNDLFA